MRRGTGWRVCYERSQFRRKLDHELRVGAIVSHGPVVRRSRVSLRAREPILGNRTVSTEPDRPPTVAERTFLEIATHGYDDLRAQIERCEVAPYDPTGWLDILTTSGPPSERQNPIQGPQVHFDSNATELAPYVETSESGRGMIELLLWTNAAGYLEAIEIVTYGDVDLIDPFGFFIEASRTEPPLLSYPPQP